jgi:O-methyltransferase involved in polyketide biosynthesis
VSDDAQAPGSVALDLDGVSETLLIPLVGRAFAAVAFPELGFDDPHGARIVDALPVDVSRFVTDTGTMRAMAFRARWMDDRARDFFRAFPAATGLSLACGLDARGRRVDNHLLSWVDLDLPAVIDIRRRFFVDDGRHRMVAGSALDAHVLEGAVGPRTKGGTPVFVGIEGLLMYLSRREGRRLLSTLGALLPDDSEIVLDWTHPALVAFSRVNRSLRATSADFRSGALHARSWARCHPRLSVVEHRSLLHQGTWPLRLGARAFALASAGQHAYGLCRLRVGAPG